MNVVIAAGGTGGHIVPGIAVAEELKSIDKNGSILFVGSGRPLEEPLVTGAGFELQTVPAVPVLGGGIKGLLRLLFLAPRAILALRRLYKSRKIDAVIGFGGYPSFFPVLAAKLLGIKTVLHEQNVQSGVANRVLARMVKRVYAPPGVKSLKGKEVIELPNPVRAEFYETSEYRAPKQDEVMRILVLGGSQGAQSLNELVLEQVEFFQEFGISLVHQAGTRNEEQVRQEYRNLGFENVEVLGFADNMFERYQAAHLIICRAGAMTVAEVSAAARPAIYVPLEIAGGHQLANVSHAAENGMALVLRQGEHSTSELGKLLLDLRLDPSKLAKMSTALASYRAGQEQRPARRIALELVSL
ncbi:MAG: undecaprenyldiphospho-muramoylpentapeptide beta-N-acetylglucosaminyltransferase [Bdellovibrionales bacterium]|nr:undecaprenyldiphospho-muramoylpentapeptide beta-N-acetylglucosaminyltransferase [Bdellovibrionales bacterium]